MTPGFATVLAASDRDRNNLFAATAIRFGTTEQNVEKDFWVCWALDALFNEMGGKGPRLLFKGGTSLSKAYGLIERFSEDIDITIFRDDLGRAASVEELEALSGKKRQARLDAIREACQTHIAGSMRQDLARILERTLSEAGIDAEEGRVEIDPDDPDQQSLLVWYPSVTRPREDGYLRHAIKIESGGKSALDPHSLAKVTPYVADEAAELALTVENVTTVNAERTFWDKVIIVHGLRSRFDRRGELRGGGQRVSRHYYDLHCLLNSEVAERAVGDRALAVDCVRHERMFFYRPDHDLEAAARGKFAIMPSGAMIEPLRRDYDAMAGMIFGTVPEFNQVIESIDRLSAMVNSRPTEA